MIDDAAGAVLDRRAALRAVHRVGQRVLVGALGHADALRPDAEPEKGYFYRSDHISLAKKGVPMLYADAGLDLVDGGEEAGRALAEDYTANRYHKPADNYSPDWDLTGMTRSMNILMETGAAMAYSDDWPNWYEGNEFRALRDEQRAAAE